MILMCAPFLKTLNCNNFRLVQRVFIFQVIRIAKLFGLVQILEDKIISWQNYLCIPSMSTRNRCIQVFTRHNTHNLFVFSKQKFVAVHILFPFEDGKDWNKRFIYFIPFQRGFDFHISHTADLPLPFNILHSLLEEFPRQYFYSKFKHIQPCSNSLVMLVNFTIQLLN